MAVILMAMCAGQLSCDLLKDSNKKNSKVGSIVVQIVDTEGRRFDNGCLSVDLFYGEDKKSAVWVAAKGTGPRGGAFTIPLTDVDIPLGKGAPRPIGDKWTFPLEGKSLPGCGTYWIRVLPMAIVDEPALMTGIVLPGRTPQQLAKALGIIEGTLVPPSAEELGPPYVITDVRPSYSTEAPPPGTIRPRQGIVRYTKQVRYRLPPTWVRTHLAEDEEIDRALVMINTAPVRMNWLHEIVRKYGKKAATPIELILERKYPLKGMKDMASGAAITVIVRGATDMETLVSADTAVDLASGMIMSVIKKATGGPIGAIVLAVVPDLVVLHLESAFFEVTTEADDFTAVAAGTRDAPEYTTGRGFVVVTNYGESMYNVQIQAPKEESTQTVQTVSEIKDVLGSGETHTFSWEVTPDSPSDAPLEKLFLFYEASPVGGDQSLYKGPLYPHQHELTIIDPSKDRGGGWGGSGGLGGGGEGASDTRPAPDSGSMTTKGPFQIVEVSLGRADRNGLGIRAEITARVRNISKDPAPLWIFDIDGHELGFDMKPRSSANMHCLGINRKITGGRWITCDGLDSNPCWFPVKRKPGERSPVKKVMFAPGETREFETGMSASYFSTPVCVFILDPNQKGIDARIRMPGGKIKTPKIWPEK